MREGKAETDVLNVPEYADGKIWWVARYSEGLLWFWGAFDDIKKAREVADSNDGIVLKNILRR